VTDDRETDRPHYGEMCSYRQTNTEYDGTVILSRAVGTGPADPAGGCRTNNLTSKNFYVHIISIFENVS